MKWPTREGGSGIPRILAHATERVEQPQNEPNDLHEPNARTNPNDPNALCASPLTVIMS